MVAFVADPGRLTIRLDLSHEFGAYVIQIFLITFMNYFVRSFYFSQSLLL